MAMECVHIPIAVSTCNGNRRRRDTSREVHCTSPLELFSSSFQDSVVSFPKSRGAAQLHNPQSKYSVCLVEHRNELEPRLLSEDRCDKLVPNDRSHPTAVSSDTGKTFHNAHISSFNDTLARTGL